MSSRGILDSFLVSLNNILTGKIDFDREEKGTTTQEATASSTCKGA